MPTQCRSQSFAEPMPIHVDVSTSPKFNSNLNPSPISQSHGDLPIPCKSANFFFVRITVYILNYSNDSKYSNCRLFFPTASFTAPSVRIPESHNCSSQVPCLLLSHKTHPPHILLLQQEPLLPWLCESVYEVSVQFCAALTHVHPIAHPWPFQLCHCYPLCLSSTRLDSPEWCFRSLFSLSVRQPNLSSIKDRLHLVPAKISTIPSLTSSLMSRSAFFPLRRPPSIFFLLFVTLKGL